MPGTDTRWVNDEDALEADDQGRSEPAGGPEETSATALPPLNEIDAAFASIVAHWDDPTPEPLDDRAADDAKGDAADLTAPAPLAPAPLPPAYPATAHVAAPVGDAPDATTDHFSAAEDADEERLFGWRGHTPPPEDEHYQPPPPNLPPVHDATYWLAVAGMTLGPLLVIWAAMVSRNPDPGWWVLTGIVLTVAGFGLMVLRGSGERDPDDNGAQV